MSAFAGRTFLQQLFHAVQQHRRSPGSQPTPAELNVVADAAAALTGPHGDVVFTVMGDALFLGSEMLPHPSLEFRGLVRAMQEHEVESVTVLATASTGDLGRLAALLAGVDVPGRLGGVRINERPLRSSELRVVPVAEIRAAYTDAVDALQRLTGGLAIDVERAGAVVDAFLSVPHVEREAGLLLATTQNCDDIVVYHSANVCLLALALGRYLGIGDRELRLLGVGALLHDVGRIARADGIAEKQDRLSGDDWSTIRLHPQEGAAVILAAARRGEELLARIALEHHIRMDGSGYPELAIDSPHLFSRIVAIADVYDAVTSDRPHRPGRTPLGAASMLLDGAGTEHDRDLVMAFLDLLGPYPPGSLLRLTGGELALVVSSGSGSSRALIVQNAAGEDIADGIPFELEPGRVAETVIPADAGVDPGGRLEQVLGLVPAR